MSLSISFSRLACTIACCALLIACDSGGSGGGSTNRGTNPPPPPPPPPDSGTWGTVSLVENQGNDASQPKVAVDANGNAIAVWKQMDGGRYNLWANRYEPDTGWGTPQLLENLDYGNVDQADIAIDANGNAMVAWWELGAASKANIMAAYYTAGVGWGAATLLEFDDRGDATTPKVAFDADGNALVVWFQYDGSHYYVWSNRFTPGTGWAGTEFIQTYTAQSGYYPELAMTADGNAVAFWQQLDPGLTSTMWSNRYTAGVGWGVAEQVSNTTGFAYTHDVATDAAGNAMAVWGVRESNLYSLWYSRYDTVAGWSTPELLENQDSQNAYVPHIEMDAAGNAMVVWLQGSGSNYSLWARRYAVGSGWGPAQLIENDDTGGVLRPQLAMDASGNVLVVWQQYDGSQYHIWSNRYVAGSGWRTAELLETGAGGAAAPQVAVASNGDGVAVWQQLEGSTNHIWSRRFE
ncbi:MAG: hypothetical protein HPY82_26755 [Gammaproteobacteria bacterium]|nr:hypothetical protein [Gammaproteobacteria bacterium]